MTTEHSTDSTSIDLKTAREKSGLTLKELYERTRISVVNLEAIEEGDFHLLPVPIYTRNFIKTYAAALGVDSKPILQRYENYLLAMRTKEKEQSPERPPDTPLVIILSQHKTALWVVVIVVVVAAISFFVSISNKPPHQPPQSGQPSPKTTANAAPQAQTAAPTDSLPITVDLPQKESLLVADQEKKESQTPLQAAAEPQNRVAAPPPLTAPKDKKAKTETLYTEEPSVLVIHATEKTWIRIQADDKEPFQVLLNPGEEISRKAARFNLDIGNAGGVRIQFEGKSIENLGKTGQVIHLRLP